MNPFLFLTQLNLAILNPLKFKVKGTYFTDILQDIHEGQQYTGCLIKSTYSTKQALMCVRIVIQILLKQARKLSSMGEGKEKSIEKNGTGRTAKTKRYSVFF